MRKSKLFAIATTLVVNGCATPSQERSEPGILPVEVAAAAAPGQDLSSARLVPEDGCYWYVHHGPVETTLLPLRSAGGGPICIGR